MSYNIIMSKILLGGLGLAVVIMLGVGAYWLFSKSSLSVQRSVDSTTEEDVRPLSFSIKLSNFSEGFHLGKGVLVVHGGDIDLNYFGDTPPEVFREISVNGNIKDLKKELKRLRINGRRIYKIMDLKDIDANEDLNLKIVIGEKDAQISFIQKVKDTEDTVSVMTSYPLYDEESRRPRRYNVLADILDVGFLSNGKETKDSVRLHRDLEGIVGVSVIPSN